MTKTPKITLSGGRDLPFSRLRLSQANVRRIQDGQSIEDLAEDIARRGLLQSLSVRPIRDDAGADTGLFEVPAGGRRFRALELLVKQKRLANDAPVPCIIRTDGLAEEDSLAENTQRLSLHPIEQFFAFKTLADKGLSEEDIAARFFVPVTVVRQRLKLALVSPVILNAYETGAIALEIVMAFTVNPDTERQEAVYHQLTTNRDLGTYRIKRLLTESSVAANDRRVLFVTMEAYVEAGGVVLRDLFTDDNGGWLSDPSLLDRLVAEKLSAAAEEVKAQGWKWVETAVDFPYGHTFDLDELVPEVPMLSEDDSAKLKSAVDEYNGIMAKAEDEELSDAAAARADELDTLIHQLENPAPVYKPEDMAIAGVFIDLDRDGTLVVDYGFVRPEDRRPEPNEPVDEEDLNDEGGFAQKLRDTFSADPESDDVAPTPTAAAPELNEPEDMSIKPLPDNLHRELTAYRTLVLRNAVAQNPGVAVTALLHQLCHEVFGRNAMLDCLEVRLTSANLPFVGGPDLKDCRAGQEIVERAAIWRDLLPKDDSELWAYLVALSDDLRAELLAHLVSCSVNALYEPAAKPGYNGPSAASVRYRLAGANRIAEAVGLDLVTAGWTPTVDNYLGRVPKPRILLAVEQGCGADAAGRIDHLKKADMAAEAEALLKATGWLPEPLRGPERKASPIPPNDNAPTAARPGDEAASEADKAEAGGFAEAAE